MKANILTLAITLTVGIILAGSLLMPVISDATTTEKTFLNKGYYEMTYTEADDVSMTWDSTDPHKVTVNDVVIDLPATADLPGPINIICGDDWFIRYTGTGLQFYPSTGSSVNAGSGVDMTVTASEGTVTITTNAEPAVTKTAYYTFLYVVSENGAYVMKNTNEAAYVHKDSEIYGIGRSTVTGGYVKIKITGSIDDGFTASEVGSSAYTFGDITVNYTTESEYIDLYRLSSLQFAVTDSSENTSNLTYSYFIVPASVTSELTNHLSNGEIAILNALPILIIVALVVMAAGALYLKRDD